MDELKHHGIKGQRWGVRRDPGSDGLVGNGRSSSHRPERRQPSGDPVQRAKSLYANRSRFSDRDLKRQLDRLDMEKKLRDLSEADRGRGAKRFATVASVLKSADTIYKVYNGPLGQAVKNSIQKKLRK